MPSVSKFLAASTAGTNVSCNDGNGTTLLSGGI